MLQFSLENSMPTPAPKPPVCDQCCSYAQPRVICFLLLELPFPDSHGSESTCSAGAVSLNLGSGRSPGGGHGNPLQYSCLENPHGQRSLVGCSPWGHKEWDTTEGLTHMQHTNRWSHETYILSHLTFFSLSIFLTLKYFQSLSSYITLFFFLEYSWCIMLC